MLRNQRSRPNAEPVHRDEEEPGLLRLEKSPRRSSGGPGMAEKKAINAVIKIQKQGSL